MGILRGEIGTQEAFEEGIKIFRQKGSSRRKSKPLRQGHLEEADQLLQEHMVNAKREWISVVEHIKDARIRFHRMGGTRDMARRVRDMYLFRGARDEGGSSSSRA